MFHESVLQGHKLMLTSSDTIRGIRRQKLFRFNRLRFQTNQFSSRSNLTIQHVFSNTPPPTISMKQLPSVGMCPCYKEWIFKWAVGGFSILWSSRNSVYMSNGHINMSLPCCITVPDWHYSTEDQMATASHSVSLLQVALLPFVIPTYLYTRNGKKMFESMQCKIQASTLCFNCMHIRQNERCMVVIEKYMAW